MAKLLELIAQHLGAGWIDVAEWLRDQNTVDDIEARLQAGDYNNVVADLQEAALKYAADTHAAYVTSGQKAAEWLDSKVTDALVRFDVTNHAALARARQNQLELVRDITHEQRTSINQVLVAGTREGTNPREMAQSIRDSIGLTSNQEAAVRSYRRALQQGDWSNALGRELSSGHTDRTIRSLSSRGGALSQAQIDQSVDRYRQNYLTYRAETIGRTEASRNVHAGSRDAYRQAIGRGDVDADQLQREWLPGPKTRYSRPDHQQMRGQRRGLDEAFTTPHGESIMFPCDPEAPVDETANCRCTVTTRFAP